MQQHIYSSPGKYDISITPGSGLYYSVASSGNNSFVGYAYTQARFAAQYIRAIELGERFIWDMGRLGYDAANLEYVSIPVRETPNSYFNGYLKATDSFAACISLKAIIVPDGITAIGSTSSAMNNFGYIIPACKCVCLPKSLNYVRSQNFIRNDYAIDSLVFPDNCTIYNTVNTANSNTHRRIHIPNGVNADSFASANKYTGWIEDINIPEGVTSMGQNVLNAINHCPKIILPSTITSIGVNSVVSYALTDCVCRATTPPNLSGNMFYYNVTQLTNQGLKIHVPYSSDHSILNAYKAATNWSTYASLMQEMDIVNDNYIKVNLVEKVDSPGSYYCLIKEISLGWWVNDLTNYPPKIYINGQLTSCTVTAGTDKVIFEYTSGTDTAQIVVNLKNGYPQNALWRIKNSNNYIKITTIS